MINIPRKRTEESNVDAIFSSDCATNILYLGWEFSVTIQVNSNKVN